MLRVTAIIFIMDGYYLHYGRLLSSSWTAIIFIMNGWRKAAIIFIMGDYYLYYERLLSSLWTAGSYLRHHERLFRQLSSLLTAGGYYPHFECMVPFIFMMDPRQRGTFRCIDWVLRCVLRLAGRSRYIPGQVRGQTGANPKNAQDSTLLVNLGTWSALWFNFAYYISQPVINVILTFNKTQNDPMWWLRNLQFNQFVEISGKLV